LRPAVASSALFIEAAFASGPIATPSATTNQISERLEKAEDGLEGALGVLGGDIS